MPGQTWIQKRVKAALRGDSIAYGEIIHEFQSGLRGYIAMLGAPPGAVEVIAQDTFVSAYRKLDMFGTDRSFSEWLRGIARNLTQQWRSRRRREDGAGKDRIMDRLMSTEVREAALQEEDAYRTSHLRRCLDKLPGRTRHILDLRYSARKKSEEIASELGIEAPAVRVSLCRIRLKLRDCVDKVAVSQETG